MKIIADLAIGLAIGTAAVLLIWWAVWALAGWICRLRERRREPEPEDYGDQGGCPTWRERIEEGEGT